MRRWARSSGAASTIAAGQLAEDEPGAVLAQQGGDGGVPRQEALRQRGIQLAEQDAEDPAGTTTDGTSERKLSRL